MPASSSPYQSRLFNFIVEQSQKLTDRAALTFRQIKVATIWGMQTVTYPFYALAQTVGWKLGTAQTSPFVFDTDITPDTPISRILVAVRDELEVENFLATLPPFEELNRASKQRSNFLNFLQTKWAFFKTSVTHPSVKLLPSHSVRGIATRLEDRNLVLVSSKNRVLDILPQSKQQQFRQQIVAEASRLQPQKKGWRTSPIERLKQWTQQTAEPLSSHPQIATVDKTVAELESRHRASFEKLKTFTQQFTQTSKETIQNTLSNLRQQAEGIASLGSHPSLPDPWLTDKPQAKQSVRLPLKPNEPISFKVLPQQPVVEVPSRKRFLDVVTTRLSALQNSALIRQPAKFTTPEGNNRELELPPLEKPTVLADITTLVRVAIEDLVDRNNIPRLSSDRVAKLSPSLASFADLKLPTNFLQTSLANLSQLYRRKTQNSQISLTESTPNVAVEKDAAIVTANSERLSPIETVIHQGTVSAQPNTSSGAETEWIETAATSTGYVKSIGERVLEWLDLAMFWIEEQILKLWQWIRQF